MNNLRLGSGRQFRSAALVEMPLPLAYDPTLLPGARMLGNDGQVYESMRDPVSGDYVWRVRAQGERGPALELQQSATHLQWRVQGNTGPWVDLVPLDDLLGPQGEQGERGPQGAGLSFQGSVATVADLPTPSTLGYGFLVLATTPHHLWVFNGATWVDAGPIQGPKGDDGDPGAAVEMRTTATEIQWRLTGTASWITLLLLADLKGDDGADGADGASVELRKTTSEIQWRLVGSPTWITLVTLDDIKGPVGDRGDQGPPGAGFAYQGEVATAGELPIPSTQGFGFKVAATGNLHIYNGIAWIDAGPLQGPKGDQGDEGIRGPAGPGFSYQGALASIALLPMPSIQGYSFRIGTDLYIYNGIAWVNAGPLQGPKGDQGDQGVQGIPGNGFAYQGTVATVAALPVPSTQGFGFKVQATGDLHIFNGIAWINAGPLQGPKGDQGDKGDQGNTGTAATIDLGTVTTGAAGSSVAVTNSGTPSAAVFNFTIPRGDKGDQGNAGPIGGSSSQVVFNNAGTADGASGLTVNLASKRLNLASFAARADSPSTPASGFTLYAAANNALSWVGANGFIRTFDGTANTENHTYTLPDASGTLMLQGAITGSGLTMTTGRLLGRSTAGTGQVEEHRLPTGFDLLGGALRVPAEIGLACSDEPTALTAGTAKITFRMPFAMTLTSVRFSVTTAPTGSPLILDVNKDNVSVFSTNPRIDVGSTTSVDSSTAAVISDSALAENAVITIDIDQTGSTVAGAGAGLKVWLIGRRA